MLAPRAVAVVTCTCTQYMRAINDHTIRRFVWGFPDIDLITKMIAKQQSKTIIVVSALWGVTDRLLRAANEPRYAVGFRLEETTSALLTAT